MLLTGILTPFLPHRVDLMTCPRSMYQPLSEFSNLRNKGYANTRERGIIIFDLFVGCVKILRVVLFTDEQALRPIIHRRIKNVFSKSFSIKKNDIKKGGNSPSKSC